MSDDLRLQKLLDITRQMAEMRALDPLLALLLDLALDLFGAELGQVILARADGSYDFRSGARRDGQPIADPAARISRSILERVILGREPVVLADAMADAEFQVSQSVQGLQLRSVMCAPLIAHGSALGAIYLENRSARGLFSPDDLSFLQVVANQAAVSVENAQLNDELEQRVDHRTAEARRAEAALREANARLLTLQQVDVELSRQLDVGYVLKIALDAAIQLSGAEAGLIGLVEGKAVRIMQASGHYADQVGVAIWNIRSIVQRVLRNRQPELIPDVSQDPDYLPYASATRAQITLPLLSHEHFMGVLNLESYQIDRFTVEAFEFLKLLAVRIAVALRNAELYQTAQRQRQVEGTLREAARVFNETLDISEVLTRIMAQIQVVVPCDTGSIQRLQGDHLEIIACHGFEKPEEVLGQTFAVVNNELVDYLVNTHQPIQIEDAAHHPFFQDYLARHPDIKFRTWLGVPLIAQNRFIGQITLDRWSVNPYSPEEIDLAMAFANHAAIALDNAELYRQQASYTQALEQTIEERERLIDELDAFAHTVAHDLKNPLGLIMGYAEMLLGENPDAMPRAQLAENLAMISHGAEKMNGIIQALLLLAGVRKADTLMIGELDMGRIVDEALLRLARVITECQAEIILPEAWPSALGYAPWIEEVWINYLSNALKYGGQPPRVELGATRQGDHLVRFWVRDNGSGLTRDEQRRIFTPFTRLRETEAEGHGLGLSIVQRIVEKLGGQIDVTSEVGRGSIFSFTLPGVGENV